MTPVSLHDLQPLLDQFTGEGQVLSCYADLAGADGFRHSWQGTFGTDASALKKLVGHTEPARHELQQNLADVQGVLESAPADARWIAVFSAHQRGFLRSFVLDVPVGTQLVAHQSPYLVPLLAAIHRRRQYLVVHTDTHRGRIDAATPGRLHLLDELDEEVPSKQHSAGERWGLGQATIARHRESEVSHYQSDLVERIVKYWDEGSYSGLILLGAHPVLEAVRQQLPSRLANQVRQELPAAWHENAAETKAKILAIVASTFSEDEEKAIAGIWDRLAENRGVATGPREVLAAIESGKIGPEGFGYLLLGPDPRETVGRCSRCRALAVDDPATCPRCQAPCVEGNLWEEVLLLALKHQIAVHLIADSDRLGPYGGMVAAFEKARAPAMSR